MTRFARNASSVDRSASASARRPKAMRRALLAALLVCCCRQAGFAALETFKGNEPGFWDSHSVVAAKIRSVSFADNYAQAVIKLSIAATVTGSFDALLHDDPLEITVPFGFGSALENMPAGTGDRILIVLVKVNGKDRFDPSIMTFFPSKTGIEKIGDIFDPATEELIRKVRAVRSAAPKAGR
jgi:hypothetical protein